MTLGPRVPHTPIPNVSDGDSDRALRARSSSSSASDTMTVAVRAQGGFVVRLE
jgi:hypothetical protein